MSYKTSQIDVATIEMLPGNIFHVMVKPGAEIDLTAAKRLIHATNQMMDDKIPFRGGIYDVSKITYINEEAREYLTSGADVKGIVVGAAIISNTSLGKMIGNMLLSLTGTKRFPIQFFESPIRAEHWVRTNMREAMDRMDQSARKVA
ncbi:MAG: hypothetical protein RL266_1164 [Bacteroidota bacterium]|jgi:hypothetical protein